MAKRKPKPAPKFPPQPDVRTLDLNREERWLLDGLLSRYRIEVAHARQHKKIPGAEAEKAFQVINRLSDRLVPEEEAAAALQDLGFEIVKKETKK